MNDYSMICQFVLSQREDITEDLLDVTKRFFEDRSCFFKKIYASTDDKVRAYGRHEFGHFTNFDYFVSIDIRSDFKSSDFEPQTRLYANIDNRSVRGTQYFKPKPLVKYTVVVRDELLDNIDEVYGKIVSLLSEVAGVSISGQAFLVPNTFGAVSFSHGIATMINMPSAYRNLLSWQNRSDHTNSFVGLFNCFSELTREQFRFLNERFGKQNIGKAGRLAWFKNDDMNTLEIGDYFSSKKYRELCGELEKRLPFKRLEVFEYGNQLNKSDLI